MQLEKEISYREDLKTFSRMGIYFTNHHAKPNAIDTPRITELMQ